MNRSLCDWLRKLLTIWYGFQEQHDKQQKKPIWDAPCILLLLLGDVVLNTDFVQAHLRRPVLDKSESYASQTGLTLIRRSRVTKELISWLEIWTRKPESGHATADVNSDCAFTLPGSTIMGTKPIWEGVPSWNILLYCQFLGVLNLCPRGEPFVSQVGVVETCSSEDQCPSGHWCHQVGFQTTVASDFIVLFI